MDAVRILSFTVLRFVRIVTEAVRQKEQVPKPVTHVPDAEESEYSSVPRLV